MTCEQGLKWLKLEDGWLCAQWARPKSDYEGVTAEGCDFAVDAELNMMELLEPWDQVMAGASRILQDAAGVADANPLVSREGWDEERLRQRETELRFSWF